MIEITAADVAEFLGTNSSLDSAALARCAAAAQAWVNSSTDPANAPAETRTLGAILLAARWYKRRSTAGGVVSAEGEFSFIPKYDSDIERMLGLNKPWVA